MAGKKRNVGSRACALSIITSEATLQAIASLIVSTNPKTARQDQAGTCIRHRQACEGTGRSRRPRWQRSEVATRVLLVAELMKLAMHIEDARISRYQIGYVAAPARRIKSENC